MSSIKQLVSLKQYFVIQYNCLWDKWIHATSWNRVTDSITEITWANMENYMNPRVTQSIHDDVIKWKLIPRYWPFVRRIHRSPVNSPHKGQWRGALMFPLICVGRNGYKQNKRNKQSWGWWFETLLCPLWHQCNEPQPCNTKQTLVILNWIYCEQASFSPIRDMASTFWSMLVQTMIYSQSNLQEQIAMKFEVKKRNYIWNYRLQTCGY